MLHAVLHGKLDEQVPEPQRREDALTSTVLGTLLLVEAWDLMRAWLGRGEPSGLSAELPVGCWFWPRLALAEPDVLLRIGDELLVVEAKFASSRHDLAVDPDGCEEDSAPVSDQLVRQWLSVRQLQGDAAAGGRSVGRRAGLAQAAIEATPVLIYLVDGTRMRRALREVAQSRAELADCGQTAELRIRTWQDLYSLLRRSPYRHRRWGVDLLCYLDRSGLGAFHGDWSLAPGTAAAALRMVSWSTGSGAGRGSLLDALEPALRFGVDRLRRLGSGADAPLAPQRLVNVPASLSGRSVAARKRQMATLHRWCPVVRSPARRPDVEAGAMTRALQMCEAKQTKRLLDFQPLRTAHKR